MKKQKHNEASRRFHDRVAGKYDAIYDEPFWEFHDRITWNHLKPLLPRDTGVPALDLGCGTGKWGFKLLKAGYPTHFVDLSRNMLNEVEAKLEQWRAQPDLAAKAGRATVLEADATDLSALPEAHFHLVTAMGDVVSICADPGKAVSEMRRVLAPGGVAVFTVDNTLAALDHFVDSGNLQTLAGFVRSGESHWLTAKKEEQFAVHMFSPAEAEALVRSRGLELVSMIGKTVLPVRRNKRFFEPDRAIETLVELEMRYWKEPAAVARASHLQLAVRRAG